jgi:hypothetical protein
VFPEPPRARVAAAALEALDFFTSADGALDQALLGACRSWAWATDGVCRSKGDTARWALSRLADPRPVARALRRRDGVTEDPLTDDDVAPVLAAARRALSEVGRG